jgi:hypothetical protein
MIAAIDKSENRLLGDFIGKSNAARTRNATLGIEKYLRAERDTFRFVNFWLDKPRDATRMLEGIILQFTLAGFVADRAIEWMINKEKFHHILAAFDGFIRNRLHDHAFGDRRGAGNLQLPHLFNFDQTHAAIACNSQRRVPAKMRDVDPVVERSLNDRLPRLRFVFVSVDSDFRRVCKITMKM